MNIRDGPRLSQGVTWNSHIRVHAYSYREKGPSRIQESLYMTTLDDKENTYCIEPHSFTRVMDEELKSTLKDPF